MPHDPITELDRKLDLWKDRIFNDTAGAARSVTGTLSLSWVAAMQIFGGVVMRATSNLPNSRRSL